MFEQITTRVDSDGHEFAVSTIEIDDDDGGHWYSTLVFSDKVNETFDFQVQSDSPETATRIHHHIVKSLSERRYMLMARYITYGILIEGVDEDGENNL